MDGWLVNAGVRAGYVRPRNIELAERGILWPGWASYYDGQRFYRSQIWIPGYKGRPERAEYVGAAHKNKRGPEANTGRDDRPPLGRYTPGDDALFEVPDVPPIPLLSSLADPSRPPAQSPDVQRTAVAEAQLLRADDVVSGPVYTQVWEDRGVVKAKVEESITIIDDGHNPPILDERAMLETCGSAGKGAGAKVGVPSRVIES